MRPTGIRQSQQFCALVESFTRRVVPRFTEQGVPADPGAFDEHRMTPRHEQGDVGIFGRDRFEQRREQMPLEVMNAQRRYRPCVRQRARERRPGQQSPDQTGAGRVGDAFDRLAIAARPRENPIDHGEQTLDMVSRGKFWHHTTVNLV